MFPDKYGWATQDTWHVSVCVQTFHGVIQGWEETENWQSSWKRSLWQQLL